MCGISGFISEKYSDNHLKSITNALKHRGPDADGFFYDKNDGIGLGHRRLSIIDLSENANQPFFSRDKRYVIVYNGELYNFKALAAAYQIAPHTSSDTEIIIEAFAKKGVDCIKDFNGIFAFAIWDTLKKTLFLARDRAGIKPLFYYFDGENLAFASEIKALLQLPIDKTLHREAFANFLYLGYFPDNQTGFKQIKKFPAGNIGLYIKGSVGQYKLGFHQYWSLEKKLTKYTLSNEQEAKQNLKQILTESVERQMISDVPLGTFLSGGIDSSTVTAIAQSLSKKPIKTFSIGFKEARFNEAEYAEKVAKYLKTDHHAFILSEKEALEKVADLLDIYDEPFADSSAIPTLLVSEMARKHVKVALSGDGGDELFMGYGTYTWAKRLKNPLLQAIRYPLGISGFRISDFGFRLFGKKNPYFQRLKRRCETINFPNKNRLKSHIFSQEQYLFSESELQNLLIENRDIDFDESFSIENRPLTAREQQSFFDIQHYLKDDLLVKVDRASMRYGLEVRVPLLDNAVLDFALNLDEKLKVKNGVSKYLLKQVLYDFIPPQYFDRPKQGFSIPLSAWLKRDLKYLIDTYLSKETVEKHNICHYSVVNRLKKRYFDGEEYLYNRLWALILLHKWLISHELH